MKHFLIGSMVAVSLGSVVVAEPLPNRRTTVTCRSNNQRYALGEEVGWVFLVHDRVTGHQELLPLEYVDLSRRAISCAGLAYLHAQQEERYRKMLPKKGFFDYVSDWFCQKIKK